MAQENKEKGLVIMRNGYFQLVNAGGGYGLKITAPAEGGEPVRINEVMDYLTQRSQVCDLLTLKKEVEKNETVIMSLGSGECPSEGAVIAVSVCEDNMNASVRVIPPSQTGPVFTAEDIRQALRNKQIVFGIDEESIVDGVEEHLYCTDILAAKGQPPRHGTDAVIEYYFNTDLKVQPTQKEDGSVDFFHLNMINHCKQGDILARLIPADAGEYGTNILGAKVKPRDVKRVSLKYGNNIQISEDKLTLTSKVNGHVTLVEDKVFVSDIFEVENVDTSIGNIDYEGSVQVNANVQSNFTVKAGGNIIVNGIVEGAYLEAGGDIIIARGMNGMNKGTLKAKGNIVVKFLENTTVNAAGSVTTESVVHSNVMAGVEVTVDGRRGFISGGKVCASGQVKAKTLGSPMGTSTIIEVGVDPAVKVRFNQAQKEKEDIIKDLQSMEPVIISYLQKKKQGMQFTQQQLQYLKTLVAAREERKGRMGLLSAELLELQMMLEQEGRAQVIATGEVYPGVKICIGEVSMAVQSNMKYCKFVKVRGDVKMVSI